jgi:Zn-dependent protease with chaperone function
MGPGGELASIPTLVAPLGAVLLPILWSLIFCAMALRSDKAPRGTKWAAYVQRMGALNLLAVPAWWSLNAFITASGNLPGPPSRWPHWFILIFPLTIGIVGGRLLTSFASERIGDRRWKVADRLGFILWKSLSSTVPLLMFAAGVDAIDELRVSGLVWIFGAAILALFATIRLRLAVGFKPRAVKAGELFKQSSAIAQRMGLPLKGVFITAAGKGQLVNAFSAPGYIGMTDLCVHRIKGPQRDFFIAHELSHIRLHHNGKNLPMIVGAFLSMAACSFFLVHLPALLQTLLKFCLILVPLLVIYSVSRRFEYAADRAAVEFTGDAESAIRALSALYHLTASPIRRGRFEELFQTHPSGERRIEAIARKCGVPSETLNNIRRQSDSREERLAGSI